MSMLIFTNFKEVDGKTLLMGQQRGVPNAEWVVIEGLDFTHTSDENRHKFLVDYRSQLEDYVINRRSGNFSTYTNDRHDPLYADKIRDEIKILAARQIIMV